MLPHELAARYIVPPLKAVVARILRDKGMGQEKIAKLLGVSQPMVSKYLRRDVEELLKELEGAGTPREEAWAVAEVLASQLLRGDYGGYFSLFTSYVNSLLSRGALCSLHHRVDSRLPPDCSVCSTLFQPSSDPFIFEVAEAVETFKGTPGAERLIPNVGSNIVAAKPGASTIAETVGLTGALVRAGGQVVAVGSPAYGGSKHTASILLLVMRRWPDRRAAVVIAYSPGCVKKLKEKGLNVIEIGPHSSPQSLLYDMAESISKVEKPVDAIADLGGHGLEPVIYVFARNATEAVEAALTCLEDRG